MRPIRPTDPAARFERRREAFTRDRTLPLAIRVSPPDCRCARFDARGTAIVLRERVPTRIA
ncbi:hypothetical protein [Burkholderia pyrrocinia]|uniref:hypothetical protein n=1 Tax=Burkholderia pyrrocinia TaxID=60550 RepID=UPI00064BC185|nr:hypothetical protein [Burkholderia pyrrocinia]AKM02288.1 hypothetical protein ABD05_18710 [Burkholderia pyrrocinia]